MLRCLFRILLTVMLFFLRRLLTSRVRSRPRGGGPAAGAGGAAPRARRGDGKGPPPLDRSDVVDVPFTEIPSSPSEPASGAGRP